MRRYRLDQTKAPLVDAVIDYINKDRLAFHMPGHMRGGAIPEPLSEWFGEKLYKIDLTEVQHLDYLHTSTGVIGEAQKLAADAFGVRETKFLINGTTVGVQSMMLSSVMAGEKIILQRNSHRCTVGGLILGGLEPVYIMPEYNPEFGEYTSVAPETLTSAMRRHPSAKAALLTTPNYFGLSADIQTLASMATIKGLRVLVDEAHGAHFPFHPEMPISACACDVDLVAQSAHKTLPTLTQSSLMHVVTARAATDRLRMDLVILQSSSPSYVFMVSLDACRRFMALHGQERLTIALEMSDWLRDEVNKVPGLHCPGKEVVGTRGVFGFDRTKITINISELGLSGWEAERLLNDEYGVEIEMSDADNILCFITVGSNWESVKGLLEALKKLASKQYNCRPHEKVSLPEIPPLEMLPRKAFYAPSEMATLKQAIGRVAADVVCPYPPGIPILIHGELITSQIVDYIEQMNSQGAFIQGLVGGQVRVIS